MSKSKQREKQRKSKEKYILQHSFRQLLSAHRDVLKYEVGVNRNKKTLRQIVDTAKKHKIDLSKFTEISVGITTITIGFKSFGALRYARKLLKLMIPDYKDELASIYVPWGKTVWIDYKVATHGFRHISIRFETTVDKIPKMYLRGGKCGIKEIDVENNEKYTKYQFVCEK